MYELYVLNNTGQQIYHYSGIDLGEAISVAKKCLREYEGAEYAYIYETVIHTQQTSALFSTYHKWFSSKKMLAEMEDDPLDDRDGK